MWDKSWDTAEQREALLAIDFSPEALAGKLAYFETGLERLRKNLEKHGGERPPELAEPLPATERAWRAWLEYTGEENPFRSGTPDWKDWNSVWQTISLHTGEWEGYPDFSSPRVAGELGLLVQPLPDSPRALGLASLLIGIWRDRNPFPERTWMAADWEEGWLKGAWIKGFLAWTWGKGQEHLDTLREAASSASILRPFEPASIESLSWLEGWDAARRRKIRDDGFEAGRRAHPEVPPEVERDSDDREAWQDGAEEGLETGRLERAFDRGGRSFDLGGSLRANPFPEGTPERSAWFQGWKSSHREIFAESNGTWRTFEECAEFGSYGHIVPALQEGVDAGLRDEPRSSNPFPPGSAEASRWDRGWTDAQEYKLESEEVYEEEEDEDHYFDDEFDEFDEDEELDDDDDFEPEGDEPEEDEAEPEPAEPSAPSEPLARVPAPEDLSEAPVRAEREQAEKAGWRAHDAGHPEEANPYGYDHVWDIGMARAWKKGWRGAALEDHMKTYEAGKKARE